MVCALSTQATLLGGSAKLQEQSCRRHSERGCVTVRGWLCMGVWGNWLACEADVWLTVHKIADADTNRARADMNQCTYGIRADQ